MKIAFAGWAGSGKTEAAKYIAHKYGGVVLSFADSIKFIDRYLFGVGQKQRERLQKIGEFFRTIDPDIWVKRTLESVEFEERVAVDDLRRKNEYISLVESGFTVIRIVADEDIRVQRLIKRDGVCDVTLMYNESESGCADLVLREISNNRTLEDMYDQIDALMSVWGYGKVAV